MNIEKQIYQIKEYTVHHTGIIGKKLEEQVARRWIRVIEKEMNRRIGGTSETDRDLSASASPGLSGRGGAGPAAGRPRIAVVVHSLAIGGGEIFPIHLANALREAGASVLFISCGMASEDRNVRGLLHPEVPFEALKNVTFLEETLKDNDIDIVHTHHAMIDTAVACLLKAGRIRARHIVTLHGMYEALDAPRARLVIEKVWPYCSRFVYITDKNLNPFRTAAEAGAIEWSDDKFTRIPNGLAGGRPKPVNRALLHIPDSAFVLCLVSRARMEKGWGEAIQIVKRANCLCSREIHLILVGDGEAYDKYHGETDRHIHFTGAKQHTRRFFMAADMGFLPSRYQGESFPLTVIDSLLCGKPVIATALGEIPAMLSAGEKEESGVAGWTFELENGEIPVEKIARQIAGIADDPARYKEMAGYCAKAVENYHIEKVAEDYQRVYDEVFAEPDVRILISCHKKTQVLRSETLRPIQAGSALARERLEDMLHDDLGDHISQKNRSYCEVTALYWAWKNLEADYYGLFHYRRYMNFSSRRFPVDRYGNIYEPSWHPDLMEKYGLTDENIRRTMEKYDVVTLEGRQQHARDGRLLTVQEQYGSADYLREKDLRTVLDIIRERYPSYIEAAETYCSGTTGYYCNMFVMRRDLFHSYCEWLFSVLEEFERRTDMTGYSREELRTTGHLAERLWGIYYTWLRDGRGVRTGELQCVMISHPEEPTGIEKWLPMDSLRRLGQILPLPSEKT